jgi:mannose-1-phosphate guanylyltransferase
MKAMVFAAGLGTRLRPLTNDRPKALVEIDGHALLEIALARLRTFGVRDVILNVHHFADLVVDYLRAHGSFGMHIEISREDVLLDTGGGLKKAGYFFLSQGENEDEPFILHNVDVLTSIDCGRMLQQHRRSEALATIAVQHRATSRYLLFDEQGSLCGRKAGAEGEPELVRPCESFEAFAFTGVHIISPRIFTILRREEAFPIVAEYLRFAASGEKIGAFRADEYFWRVLGSPESILIAEQELASGRYKQ